MTKQSDDEKPKEKHELDDLIRQYREAEKTKDEDKRVAPDLEPEMSSFILQHYDRVLLLEPNEAVGEAAFRLLKAEGYNVEWETEKDSVFEILENEKFTTLIVSEGFSADSLIIRDTLKKKGLQTNLRIIKDFGTTILGHEESSSLKDTRHSFCHLLEFVIRLLESYYPTMVGHSKEVARISREIALKMELLPDVIDGVTISAYMYKLDDLHERYMPFWKKSEDIFEDVELNLPNWKVTELTRSLRYPYPIEETLKHIQERFDGKGYPDGLEGEEIPIASRIIAPVDIYLNMISSKMGQGLSQGEAIDQLIIDSESSFDPTVVEILVGLLKTELTKRERTEYRETLVMVDNYGEDDLIKIQLREEGYSICSTDNLTDALNIIEQKKPAVVISDIDLKSGTGFQLLDKIRNQPEFRDTPFLVMSGRSESEFVSKALRSGADDYLPRPIKSDILLAKIARNITRSKYRGGGLAERRGVTGSLRDLGILEIIQILGAGNKNAMLILTDGQDEARVSLTDGKIVYAIMGDKEGKEAFYKLIGWERGEFAIHMNVSPPKENITIGNDMLLLEGFRRLDETKRK